MLSFELTQETWVAFQDWQFIKECCFDLLSHYEWAEIQTKCPQVEESILEWATLWQKYQMATDKNFQWNKLWLFNTIITKNISHSKFISQNIDSVQHGLTDAGKKLL